MKNWLKLALLAAAILAAALFHSRLTRACGPFFPQIIFINTVHPDLPIGEYATGNLGIIQTTYETIYLYVAYRNLAGRPFSPAEQAVLWGNDPRLLTGQGLQSDQTSQTEAHSDWRKAWYSATGQPTPQEARSLQFESGVQLWAGVYRPVAVHESGSVYYSQYLNCPQDAFHSAVNTVQRLTEQFGETSPVVKDWIQAQQTVFGDCSGGNTIPDPMPPGAPAIARADRAYQIAAAHFYSGGYDKAAEDFLAIAKDTSSPWSTIAPYLVARSLVRKATMVEKEEPDLDALAQAEAQVNSVLSDPRRTKYHAAAEQLRGFIEFRLHPAERLIELANNMTKFSGDPNLAQDAIDFKLLFPRVVPRYAYRIPPPIDVKEYSQLADVRAKSDLLDWMITLQLGGPEAYTHSFEKWKRTNSLAWLVAALMKATLESPHVSDLLAAAGKVSTGSSSFDSLTFYSLRLMLLQGKDAEVRQRLASLDLHRRPPLGFPPRSAMNLYLAMRFEIAQNLDELFANAPRVPAMLADTSEGGDMPAVGAWGIKASDPHFDDDAVMVFNRFLPVIILAKAVHSASVPENLRREVALAAWTRAALLGDAAVARSLAPAVETFVPELTASVRSYDSAKTPAARRFAAVLAALRFPGLRPFVLTYGRSDWNGITPLDQINNYRDNWWGSLGPTCAPTTPYNPQSGYPHPPQWPQVGRALQTIYPEGKVKPPAFLTAKEQSEAASEWQRMLSMGSAPNYLSAQVLAWAKAHPSDPRVPEALALAVRTTRFGRCMDKETGNFSKAAFDLLHSRYPKSSWTAQTKYWFKM